MRGTVGLAIGLALGAAAVMAASAPPPPVILNLGEVVPTPRPTANPYDKQRIITTISVQNSPEGETRVLFEAMDFHMEPASKDDKDQEKKVKTLASKRYTITRDTPEMKGMRDRVLRELRVLEADMLAYVATAGPPEERKVLAPSEAP